MDDQTKRLLEVLARIAAYDRTGFCGAEARAALHDHLMMDVFAALDNTEEGAQ